jgi:hypothetical protein
MQVGTLMPLARSFSVGGWGEAVGAATVCEGEHGEERLACIAATRQRGSSAPASACAHGCEGLGEEVLAVLEVLDDLALS